MGDNPIGAKPHALRQGSRGTLLAIAAAFILWATRFIFESSVVGFDGLRRFSLFDDAMISMRYAWNLSHAKGLVWNEGEYIEGITNMLMTLYMAFAALLFDKSNAVLFIQLSGILFMLATAVLALNIGDLIMESIEIPRRELASVLIFAGALFYYPLAFWSLMGMETGLLTVLLLGSVYIAIRTNGQARFIPVLPVLLGFAFWTRPDAAVPAGIIAIYRLLGIWRGTQWQKTITQEASVFVAFVAALTLLRWLYYGEPVPNTYLLRTAHVPLLFRIENSLGFIRLFLESAIVPLGLAILSVAIFRNRHMVLLLSLILASIGYQMYAGGDPWLYWRMMSPFMPLLFALCVIALCALVRAERVEKFAPSIIIGGACALLLGLNGEFLKEMTFEERPYTTKWNQRNVNVAMALREVTFGDASIGVLLAGTLPYYADRTAIDFLGKSDRYIASLPPDLSGKMAIRGMKSLPSHNKYDLNYSIVEKRPTYVQTGRWGRDDVRDFLKREYVHIKYKGVPLHLARDSKSVNWEKLARELGMAGQADAEDDLGIPEFAK